MVGKIIIKTIKILLLLFAAGFTIAFSFWFGQTLHKTFWSVPDEVEVPNLVGEDAAVADNKLVENGLSLKIIDSKYQLKYPSNTIVKQDPSAGIMVRKGREVLAVVSLGPELAEVPDLRGLSLRDSRVLLSNSKLKMGNISKTSKSRRKPGEVLVQNPWPGKKVKKGSSVNLQVNRGDEPMRKVPNIVGKKISEVEDILKKKTLGIGTVVWVWHDYIPKGEIIRQIPNPGSLAQPRSKVDVKLSAGQRGLELNLKQRNLILFASKGQGLQTIRVKQLDAMGDKVVYEGQHAPGGKISLTVHCRGDTEIQIYHNTKLVKRIRF
ncbi:MAG: PASTA domain-containing protein [Candidatus Eremiobacteraeota bacterium]|nr:PASTA domain-containing protein [Candidatus Eremiobacteraeota bacterium]